MPTDDAAEQAVLRILVADGSAFQRRLTTEMLRAGGRVQIDYAENIGQCLMALSYCQPDVLIADWDIDEGSGLTLVKRIRAGEAGAAFRKLAIIMVAPRQHRQRHPARAQRRSRRIRAAPLLHADNTEADRGSTRQPPRFRGKHALWRPLPPPPRNGRCL
ncbi:MAG: response regulator [Caulobacteraceae bacterium]|nr:response regulator [Caulobacteraceae bacterium]